MTRSEIISAILDYVGQESGGGFEDFVGVLLNDVYQRVLDTVGLQHEERVFTLTSVADQAEYGLSLYVRRILNIEDPTTPRFVYETTRRFFDRNYPGTTTSGTPTMAFPLGVRGVEALPASDGVVTVESDSSSDAGSHYRVRLTGFDSTGLLVSELVTLSGTAAASSTNSYDSTLGLSRMVKETDAGFAFSGNITVKDSDGNTLAAVPSWWSSATHQWIRFHPIPGSAITYNIRAEMRKPPLMNDTDWPEFEEAFHGVLVFGVTKSLLPTMGQSTTGQLHAQEYEKIMRELGRSEGQTPAALFRFAEVQNNSPVRNRPTRPLIQGVDFGLVS